MLSLIESAYGRQYCFELSVIDGNRIVVSPESGAGRWY